MYIEDSCITINTQSTLSTLRQEPILNAWIAHGTPQTKERNASTTHTVAHKRIKFNGLNNEHLLRYSWWYCGTPATTVIAKWNRVL